MSDHGEETPGRPLRQKRVPNYSRIASPPVEEHVGTPLDPLTSAQLKFCERVLHEFVRKDYQGLFVTPVRPTPTFAPDYFEIVKEPMDYKTIEDRFRQRYYKSPDDFVSDMNLIFDNAVKYNGTMDTPDKAGWIGKEALTLKDTLQKKMQTMPSHVNTPASKGKKSAKKTPLSDDPKYNRPMTYQEKAGLRDKVAKLPKIYMKNLLAIIKESLPKIPGGKEGKITVEIDKLAPVTLRKLEEFVDGILSGVAPDTTTAAAPTVPKEEAAPEVTPATVPAPVVPAPVVVPTVVAAPVVAAPAVAAPVVPAPVVVTPVVPMPVVAAPLAPAQPTALSAPSQTISPVVPPVAAPVAPIVSAQPVVAPIAPQTIAPQAIAPAPIIMSPALSSSVATPAPATPVPDAALIASLQAQIASIAGQFTLAAGDPAKMAALVAQMSAVQAQLTPLLQPVATPVPATVSPVQSAAPSAEPTPMVTEAPVAPQPVSAEPPSRKRESPEVAAESEPEAKKPEVVPAAEEADVDVMPEVVSPAQPEPSPVPAAPAVEQVPVHVPAVPQVPVQVPAPVQSESLVPELPAPVVPELPAPVVPELPAPVEASKVF